MRNPLLILVAALICGIVVGCAGCTSPVFGGEVSVMERPTAHQYQLQTVQDPPTVQYQTRSKTIAVPRQVQERVAVQKTVMVPKTVTEYQTRTRTECVECEVQERVAVRVQNPPRTVRVAVEPVQTVAIGLRANEGLGSRLRARFGRYNR